MRASEPAGEILSEATLVAESKDLWRSRNAGVRARRRNPERSRGISHCVGRTVGLPPRLRASAPAKAAVGLEGWAPPWLTRCPDVPISRCSDLAMFRFPDLPIICPISHPIHRPSARSPDDQMSRSPDLLSPCTTLFSSVILSKREPRLGGERTSKDPEDVYCSMPRQGVLPVLLTR